MQEWELPVLQNESAVPDRQIQHGLRHGKTEAVQTTVWKKGAIKMTRKERGFGTGSIVKHFKGGVYRIEDFARHTETNEFLVIYRQLSPPYYCYAMPERIFCSEVDHEKYPDAVQEYRFEKMTKQEALEKAKQS
jgi:hypothetical protein